MAQIAQMERRAVVEVDEPASLRNETDLERVDRNLNELLQELRVVATGVQVLFAFLLIVPFSVGFSHLAPGERYLYFAILLATAASAGLLIAPTALHRLIFRRGDKPYLIEVANRMAITGITSLMFAMTGILALLSGYLFGSVAGTIVAIGAGVFFGSLWFGIGVSRRRWLNRSC
ncbi:MAG TPA: DUF6328 family protein [Thermoleophilaceae bacterium]|nr:DUF6328 family protein [Thermoleophilaceae bacterium]